MSAPLSHPLRSDARDNRDRIVSAARALFAEHGIDVPMRDIARAAGVGPATLYRRFPTRQAIVDEAFSVELDLCRGVVDDACADPDAGRGIRSVLERILALHAENHGLVDAILTSDARGLEIAQHRSELLRSLSGLVRRAREAGQVRSDASVDDLAIALMAARGLSGLPERSRRRATRRFAELAIHGLRA